jgi:hypothetical protein
MGSSPPGFHTPLGKPAPVQLAVIFGNCITALLLLADAAHVAFEPTKSPACVTKLAFEKVATSLPSVKCEETSSGPREITSMPYATR